MFYGCVMLKTCVYNDLTIAKAIIISSDLDVTGSRGIILFYCLAVEAGFYSDMLVLESANRSSNWGMNCGCDRLELSYL